MYHVNMNIHAKLALLGPVVCWQYILVHFVNNVRVYVRTNEGKYDLRANTVPML